MKTNVNEIRRKVLIWSAPTVAGVTLPVHAMTSVASLSITKEQTGGPNPATTESDVLEYTVVVTNTGDLPITGVVVTDTLPDGTVVTLMSPAESITADSVLEVGEVWTYESSYTVTMDDLIAGADLTNTVSVTADDIEGEFTDDAVVSVTQLRACTAPPVVTVPVAPKCAGDPPIGEAAIDIVAPDDIPMELKGIEVTTDDPTSTIADLPAFPAAISDTSGITVTWTGPAGDAIACLPTASISITIEYCCEDEVSLFETYDITALLLGAAA